MPEPMPGPIDSWEVASDNPWTRGLRYLQGWWRENYTDLGPGHIQGRAEPVVSTLPAGIGHEPNLMTPESVHVAVLSMERLRRERHPGIINERRLCENLLSSQPLCFNLFGYLAEHPDALLTWVRTIAPEAQSVSEVLLEWAPIEQAFSRSAFDVFISYELPGGAAGFVSVECKYAEDLRKGVSSKASDKFLQRTTAPHWNRGSTRVLDRAGPRQLWYNQLLTQHVQALLGFQEACGVVVACDADQQAREYVSVVRRNLTQPESLQFVAIEEVLGVIQGHEEWKSRVAARYVDFSPIQSVLGIDDPRRC